ncbi:MAG: hypothetical protein WBI82_01750 [Sphaerochaeta sp.]
MSNPFYSETVNECNQGNPWDVVIVYTATTVFRYPSLTSCARAYGVARSTIIALIATGSTWVDGITTFDVPVDSKL